MCIARVSNTGLQLWKHCSALRKGRAAFCGARPVHQIGAPRELRQQHSARTGQNLVHQKFLPCPPQGQGSILQHQHARSKAPTAARTFSALPSRRAGQPPRSKLFWAKN
ncbi:uncharacterized protein DS421_10g301510 [Arachis hypogaea]|nr:uncharacterized protein DS421_10g301510 [Arachis hypogaea]